MMLLLLLLSLSWLPFQLSAASEPELFAISAAGGWTRKLQKSQIKSNQLKAKLLGAPLLFRERGNAQCLPPPSHAPGRCW
jgi:hypothetical protein